MTPPRWVDDDGRVSQTRPCPRCGRVIPVKRRKVEPAPGFRRRPYEVLSFIEWCGHGVEVILVPEGDGWLSEIPVLGEAT